MERGVVSATCIAQHIETFRKQAAGDAKADFGPSAQIRTGVSRIWNEHLRVAPFLNGQFPRRKRNISEKRITNIRVSFCWS